MTVSLRSKALVPTAGEPWPARHVCLVLPVPVDKRTLASLPDGWRAAIMATLKRRHLDLDALGKEACSIHTADGTLLSVTALAPAASVFDQGVTLRKALQPLLDEHPQDLAVALYGDEGLRASAAERAVFSACVNGTPLALPKSGKPARALKTLHLLGVPAGLDAALARTQTLAEANTLARQLTVTPPNALTPALFRKRVALLAKQSGWTCKVLDLPTLRRMKAGAFVAVAQGSEQADAAIVHLSWKPRGARRRLALVGKGICFDTGGHNLKTARGMYGMHEDMNGAAVALATLQALSSLRMPVEIHCFLALAENHLSPRAYKQNDVITALNGTTIEIVHTDAEGRMVLADTLTLAAREKPDLILDYATLTGSMVTALGTRQCGVIASRLELETLARGASVATGERVVCFAAEADYDAELESQVADVKQCLQEGEADHLLAARFLSRFKGDADWIHMDLSAYRHAGGLGAVASAVNGFGVAWSCALVDAWLGEAAKPKDARRSA